MASVNLPNIDITNNDIDAASLPQLQKIVKALLNTTAILTEELTFLLNNLDTKNVNEIDGDVLVEGTVTADKVAANSITADKMNVNELSAITANLGHITAGLIEAVEIYGSLISGGTVEGATVTTRIGSGRGIVMNSGWADLEIYSGVGSAELIFSIRDLLGDASVVFEENGDISAINGDLTLRAQRIFINAPDGVFVNGVQIG